MDERGVPVADGRRGTAWITLFRLLSAVAVAWAGLNVWYFLRTNPALWNEASGLAHGVFSGLFIDEWTFTLDNSPPVEIVQSLVALLLTTLLGVLVLRAADVLLPRLDALCLGLMVGLGVSGVAFELLTMAHGLTVAGAWLTWAGLFALVLGILFVRQRRGLWRWWHPASADALIPELDGPEIDRQRLLSGVRLSFRPAPCGFIAGAAGAVILLLILLITIAIFWNAVFFPETYWDSLILYIGYARMTFLQHAFPFKAEVQVGIGLGANHPHLFSTYGAVAATMMNHWSDLPLRVLAPVAGTASVGLVYATLREVWSDRFLALLGAALFRTIPLGIAYSTFASDYSLTILAVSAFLYSVVLWARFRTPGALLVMTFLPAAAMHLNYLMGILWVPWALALFLGAGRSGREAATILSEDERIIDLTASAGEGPEPEAPIEIGPGDDASILAVLRSRPFRVILFSCILLGSTWLVRNAVLTGNPVYAFFPQFFPNSVRINREVLKSAEIEWFRNGDGISRVAEVFADARLGRERDQGAQGFQRAATLGDKLRASWLFWAGYDTRGGHWGDRARVAWSILAGRQPTPPIPFIRWQHAYKMAPVALGFTLPGILLGLLLLLAPATHDTLPLLPERRRAFLALTATTLLLVACLLAFHYLLADFYLYQIICIVGCLAILGTNTVAWLVREYASRIRVLPLVALALVGVTCLVPGLAMALMNFKVVAPGVADGVPYNVQILDVFRNPGMPARDIYQLRFGDEMRALDRVNETLKGQPLLTHENRHYLLDPSIRLVHLDDWDIQSMYTLTTNAERVAFLRARGLTHYLRVPNEANHEINRRAGMQEMIDAGLWQEVYTAGGATLYELKGSG